MDEIPQLSASWLTETLRAEGIIGPKVKVKSRKSRALDGGLMASTFLLELAYSRSGGTAPRTMVGKFPSLNPDSRTAGLEMRAYEREIMFYRQLSKRVNMRVPICYHANIDTQTGEFSLLMEDLSSAIVADPETPGCFELAERSVKQLARLQKATWANDEIRDIPWVLDYSDAQYMQQIKSWAKQGWEIIKSVADERLPLTNQHKGDRLLEGLDVWSEMVRLRGCLAHCDYRFANVLYGETEAITVDWQTLHWSNPGTDIAYFLNNSLSPEQRAEWQDTLRKTYFDALIAEGVTGYTKTDSDVDFRFGLVYNLLMLMVTTFGVGANHLSEPARNQILGAFSRGFLAEADYNAIEILNKSRDAAMELTPHDEFLHLGYPKDKEHPWKENYYFNYIDREADAMGIFHASIQRHKGIASIKAISVIGGKPLTYAVNIPWPPIGGEVQNDSVIITDGKLIFEIIEPYKKQRVTFEDGETRIAFDYTDRFREYLYDHENYIESQGDKALDVIHYEQGMHVNGEIKFDGQVRKISCLGHRDHTWGFRDEQGLRGWNWIAVQGASFTLNFSKVRRRGLPDSEAGFISYADRNEAVTAVEVLDIAKNDDDEPIVCKYRVTLKSGTQLTVLATRFLRMFLPAKEGMPVVHHENFSDFIIEETGETGIGIDEHMVLL